MTENDLKITVETKVDDDGLIHITTDFMGNVTREICNTKDQQIRNGLIKLGWTPPSDDHVKSEPDCSMCKHWRNGFKNAWCEAPGVLAANKHGFNIPGPSIAEYCPAPDHPLFEKRD